MRRYRCQYVSFESIPPRRFPRRAGPKRRTTGGRAGRRWRGESPNGGRDARWRPGGDRAGTSGGAKTSGRAGDPMRAPGAAVLNPRSGLLDYGGARGAGLRGRSGPDPRRTAGGRGRGAARGRRGAARGRRGAARIRDGGEAGRGRVFDRLDDGEGRHQTPQMQQLTRTSRPMCIRIVHRGYGGEGRLTAHPRAVDAPKRGPRATRYQRVAPVRRRSGAGARAPRPAPSGTRASMPRPNRAFFPPTRSRRYPSR